MQPQQQQQPAGGSYHGAAMHQESMYMKGSPSGGYYQQPVNTSYEEYYQHGTPTRGYYQNAPHMAGYHASYGQENMPISEFWLYGHLYIVKGTGACRGP